MKYVFTLGGTLLFAVLFAIFLLGCGKGKEKVLLGESFETGETGRIDGGGEKLPPPDELPESPEDFISQVVLPNLRNWINPSKAALDGVVEISGLTLLPMEEIPGGEMFLDDLPFHLTRIIDDEDNIGDAELPDELGGFLHADTRPVFGQKLNIIAKVAEDLDGDGTGGDWLNLFIPVNFAPGKITEFNARISPVDPANYQVPWDGGIEREGFVIELFYEYSGPEGRRVVRQAIDFREGRIVIDSDGDEIFKPPDIVGEDLDNDGRRDDIYEVMSPETTDAERLEFEGYVLESTPGLIILSLLPGFMDPVLVIVDDRTAVMSPDGSPLSAAEIKVGDFIFVIGIKSEQGKIVGLTVVILPESR